MRCKGKYKLENIWKMAGKLIEGSHGAYLCMTFGVKL